MAVIRRDHSEFLRQFSELKVWKRGAQRAPHKPLLILLTLGRIAAGRERLAFFAEIEEPLRKLLRDFGPTRKSYHPEFPFWHLQSDGIWEIPHADQLEPGRNQSSVYHGNLIQYAALGGFTPEIFHALKSDPKLIRVIARMILTAHFPESYHDDLLLATGLECLIGSDSELNTMTNIIPENSGTPPRNPEFRHRILRAYDYRCCVCGMGLQLGLAPVGVEAAHIKWHQAGGPAEEPNGLCLCTLHHKLFDRGAWGLSESLQVVVSEETSGPGKEEWLLRFLGHQIRIPSRSEYRPAESFRQWHVKEVLQHPFLDTCKSKDAINYNIQY